MIPRRLLWFGGGAFFICYLTQTALGVVTPTMRHDLHLSAVQDQWVVNALFLALALCAAPAGRLGDEVGHRRVLVGSLAVVAAGSLGAAVAGSFGWLVGCMALTGAGAAALFPSSAALVANASPDATRGHAMGAYSAIGVSVFAVGPLAAGVLTDGIGWRAVFVLQAGLAAATGIAGLSVPERHGATETSFDAVGLVLLLTGLGAVLVALMESFDWGWHAPATVVLFAAGAAVLVAFGLVELRTRVPLLETHLLGVRTFRDVAVAMFAAQFMLSSFAIFIATYFQQVLGFGPLVASVAMLPAFGIGPVNALLSGGLTDRFGARTLAVAGFGITTAALAWLAAFAAHDQYALLVPGLVVFALGIGPIFTALVTAVANAATPAHRGGANALVLTVRWIGAAAGAAVLGAIVHAGASTHTAYTYALAVDAAVTAAGLLACRRLPR